MISHQRASNKRQKVEQMFSILNRALSWAITSFGNEFCLKKRSRLIKALDNRFYAKFMQLEIGQLAFYKIKKEIGQLTGYFLQYLLYTTCLLDPSNDFVMSFDS